jgi:hypothetical protein
LHATLAELELEGVDVAVFPFVRLGAQSCTFLDPAAPPPDLVTPWRGFSQRYHTNNYALLRRICRPPHLAAMQDHFDASAHGDAAGLADRHFGTIVSATNKTPCAASFLHEAVRDPAAFRAILLACITRLRGIALPAPLAWMGPPIDATIALFSEALPP